MSIRPYLGTNVNPVSAEELRQRGILEEDEVLLALFDGILLDEKRRRIGGIALTDFVALTDRRLITWARGFFNDTIDRFSWQDTDVTQAETWDPWHGRVIMAFRIPAVAPRTRRIAVRGMAADRPQSERVIVNTLDYMPADDVTPLSNMIGWVGDQVMAGLAGENLVMAFANQFAIPEKQLGVSPFAFVPEPQMPPPPPKPISKPKRRWWQRAIDGSEDGPQSTGNLIADYENRRSSMPAGDGAPSLPVGSRMPVPSRAPMPSQMPIMPDQPSMYGMSRTLRLFFEAPRNFVQSVRRAGEMMSGASEMVSGLQDPQVRRNAMFGIYQAAAQQEAQNGPFAPVGPVVRAVVRFAEPLPDEAVETQAQDRRGRIQVRANDRLPAQTENPPQIASAVGSPSTESPPAGAVRRSVSVRRAHQETEEPAPSVSVVTRVASAPTMSVAAQVVSAPEVSVAAQVEAPQRVPVRRRLVVNHDSEEQRAVSAVVSDDER